MTDLFDSDWGYGPYFHQTFLERRGNWFLLPAVPFPQPVWINVNEFANEPNVRLVERGEIITMPGYDLVVLGIDRGVFRARRAQDADMPCGEDSQLPLTPSTEIRLQVEDLYSPTGHLLADIKYKRGC